MLKCKKCTTLSLSLVKFKANVLSGKSSKNNCRFHLSFCNYSGTEHISMQEIASDVVQFAPQIGQNCPTIRAKFTHNLLHYLISIKILQ